MLLYSIQEIIRNAAAHYKGIEKHLRKMLQDIGIRPRDLRGIDIDAALRRGIGDNNTMDVETRERAPINNGSSSDSRKYKGLLSGETKEIIYLKTFTANHFPDSELDDNLKKGDGFDKEKI